MRTILMIAALVVAVLTIAATVGCSGNSTNNHDLRGPGPVKNYGQAI